jgi:hypothetical protein
MSTRLGLAALSLDVNSSEWNDFVGKVIAPLIIIDAVFFTIVVWYSPPNNGNTICTKNMLYQWT